MARIYKRYYFNLLGPVGDVVEEWTLKGTYIEQYPDFDEDDTTSDPTVEITLIKNMIINSTILRSKNGISEIFKDENEYNEKPIIILCLSQ